MKRMNDYTPRSRVAARSLRRQQTDAERKLWRGLRSRSVEAVKFRRQYPIGPYIVDFYCHEARLVIEADGSQHGDDADRKRDEYLRSRGLRVLRFWNNEVLLQIDAVLEAIRLAVVEHPHPDPLPEGEGIGPPDPTRGTPND